MPAFFSWTKRLILVATFLALIVTNVLTLTNTAFNSALSGALAAATGVRTVSSMLQSKIASQDTTIKKQKNTAIKRKAATRRFGTRLASRTKRVVGKSIAAIPAESIPFLGVAVLIADTGYEIYAARETLRDLDELYVSLNVIDAVTDDAMHGACNPELPDPGEVWDGVVAKSGEWLDQARAAM